jgi:hypothetical protein
MDYTLHDAARAGVERVVFVLRREMAEEFDARHGRRYARRLEVAYAFQELEDVPAGFAVPAGRRKPWGTAHAVLAARGAVRGPFLVANADDFYGAAGLRALVDFLRQPEEEDGGVSPETAARYALVAYELAKTLSAHGAVARGVCDIGADGTLRAVAEHTGVQRDGEGIRGVAPDGTRRRFTGREPVSMNLWGFRPSLFGHLGTAFARFLAARWGDPAAELYLPAVVDELIREGKKVTVRVLTTPDPWFGVTYREDRAELAARLRELVARGDYPEGLWD